MTATQDDDELDIGAMSAQDLLQEAAYLRVIAAERRADARRCRTEAEEESRDAGQREHEAGRLEEAAAALTALQEASRELPGLEARAEGAVAAERAAVDKLRRAERNLTRRQAEEQRARAGGGDPAERDEAAVRTFTASGTADEARAEAVSARSGREKADRALREQQLEVSRLETLRAAAAWRAQHPGQAARGQLTVADMTDSERQGLAFAALLFAGPDKPEPARPSPGEVLQDVTRFRRIRGASSMLVIPPAASGGRP